MSVISQGFDYRPEEVLCSQAAREEAPAQAPQPFSQLTTMPWEHSQTIAWRTNDLCTLMGLKVLNAHLSLRDQDHLM